MGLDQDSGGISAKPIGDARASQRASIGGGGGGSGAVDRRLSTRRASMGPVGSLNGGAVGGVGGDAGSAGSGAPSASQSEEQPLVEHNMLLVLTDVSLYLVYIDSIPTVRGGFGFYIIMLTLLCLFPPGDTLLPIPSHPIPPHPVYSLSVAVNAVTVFVASAGISLCRRPHPGAVPGASAASP